MSRATAFGRLPVVLLLVAVACGPPEPEPEAGSAAAPGPPPNILLIVADDLGWGDLSRHSGVAQTPRLDALAEESLRLDRFHAFPLCTPSRVALLTGRSPLRTGLAWSPLRPWSELGLPEQEQTLAEALQSAGYRTGLIGKWHLGHSKPAHHPQRHGFEHFYGFLTGAIDYDSHVSRDGGLDWQRNGETVVEEGYVTHLLTDEACRLIADWSADEAPWFLFLSYSAPHKPLQAPPEAVADYAHVDDFALRLYCAMLAELDRGVARVLLELERVDADENTLVVFLSDNGAALAQGGDTGQLRGGKSVVFEGGLRVPAFLRWPRVLPRDAADFGFTSVLDLAPTLARAAGAGFPEVDGRDLFAIWQIDGDQAFPRLRRMPDDAPETVFVAHNESRGQMAIFRGPWKYVHRLERDGEARRELLYRIDRDPTEEHPVQDDYPDVARELRTRLAAWLSLDPEQPTLETLPTWDGDRPQNWKAPATWAGAVSKGNADAEPGQ